MSDHRTKDPLPAWQCDHSTNEVSSDGKSCRACTRERDENALTPRPNEAPACVCDGVVEYTPQGCPAHPEINVLRAERIIREARTDSASPVVVTPKGVVVRARVAEGVVVGLAWDDGRDPKMCMFQRVGSAYGHPISRASILNAVDIDPAPRTEPARTRAEAIEQADYTPPSEPMAKLSLEKHRRERATVSACRLCGAHPAKADGDCGLHPIASKAQRIEALEEALERIHKGEQPAHKIASDALWKSRGERR